MSGNHGNHANWVASKKHYSRNVQRTAKNEERCPRKEQSFSDKKTAFCRASLFIFSCSLYITAFEIYICTKIIFFRVVLHPCPYHQFTKSKNFSKMVNWLISKRYLQIFESTHFQLKTQNSIFFHARGSMYGTQFLWIHTMISSQKLGVLKHLLHSIRDQIKFNKSLGALGLGMSVGG